VQCCWTSERVHMSVEAGPCARHAGGRFNSTSASVGRTHPPSSCTYRGSIVDKVARIEYDIPVEDENSTASAGQALQEMRTAVSAAAGGIIII
jgi:hypothetical protein